MNKKDQKKSFLKSKIVAYLPRINFMQFLGLSITLLMVGFFLFFLLIPLGLLFKSALMSRNSLNYFMLLSRDTIFKNALYNSIKIATGTTLLTTIVALPLAIVNNKFNYTGKKVLTYLIFSSMILPPLVGIYGLKHFLSTYGTVNNILRDLGLIKHPLAFLGSGNIFTLIVIQTLNLYSLMYLCLTSALERIDPSLEEVSETLGVRGLRRYKDLIWPLIRPGFLAGILLVFIRSFMDLGTPLIMNYDQVLPVMIFSKMSSVHENTYAHVIVFFMTLLTICFLLPIEYLTPVDHRHKSPSKSYKCRSMIPTTFWEKVGIYFIFIPIIFCSLLPHLGMLLTSVGGQWIGTYFPSNYSLDAYRHILTWEIFRSITNSLFYASTATAFTLLIAIFGAYLIVKKKPRFYLWINALLIAPLFIPGIVLAFSYLFTYINTPLDPRKNPTFLLVMVYSMRNLPYMVRLLVAGLQQVNDDIEEAATVFGASLLQRWRDILLPFLLPNLITSSLLVFVRIILEVSSTLMLASKEKAYPITKMIYALANTPDDGLAKASALGVVTMLLVSLIILLASKFNRIRANGNVKKKQMQRLTNSLY